MAKRIPQIDFLKCIFITLMVVFHLTYIGDLYPYAKQVVYTFHMPAFLIISGYLASTRREPAPFLRKMGWLLLPYACMEVGYVIMSSILPVREAVERITPALLLDKVLLHPMGPYWYLHLLLLCSLIHYALMRYVCPRRAPLQLLLLACCLCGLLPALGVASWQNALYFCIGATLQRCSIPFTRFFQPLWAGLPLLIWLCCYPQNLDRGTVAGMAITYLTICLLLALCRMLSPTLMRPCCFIGRNTLLILLFSPIFTMLSKVLLTLFAFDPTGMLFLLVATTLALAGSLGIGHAADRLHLSRFFFGKEKVVI